MQDEPEIVMRFNDIIDVLLLKIRTAAGPTAAAAYASALGRLIGDFIPPSEILTKCIKELLCAVHPYPECVARIVRLVFRATIDAAYLPLLQDWLICTMGSFVSQPGDRRRVVWSLTVIFVAASIDAQLLRLFDVVLAVGAPQSASALLATNDGVPADVQNVGDGGDDDLSMALLRVSVEDFCQRLNREQRHKFRLAVGESGRMSFILDWTKMDGRVGAT